MNDQLKLHQGHRSKGFPQSPHTWDRNITIAVVHTETGAVLWSGPKISALEAERIGDLGFDEVQLALTCLPPDGIPGDSDHYWHEELFCWVQTSGDNTDEPTDDTDGPSVA